MPRSTRKTIAPNTYRDNSGIDTEVRYRGRLARERWPLDADPDELARWVRRMQAALRDRAAENGATVTRPVTRGTLAGEVAIFLATRKGRPGYGADRCHLAAWVTRLGPKRRTQIKTSDVDLAIAAWRTERPRKSDQTIIHRCRALRVLCRHFDGPKARTPVDDAQVPRKPKPHPTRLPVGTIQAVADRLRARAEKAYRSDRQKTYARFLVLSLSLQRPDQLMRAKPEDVDLARGVWMVRSAKGEPSHAVYFNEDIRHAWDVFIAADAWGPYKSGSYGKQLRAAGYPAGISTYNVRHEGAADALERGADLGDIQGLLGHTDIETTRRNYAGLVEARQKNVSAAISGRFKREK